MFPLTKQKMVSLTKPLPLCSPFAGGGRSNNYTYPALHEDGAAPITHPPLYPPHLQEEGAAPKTLLLLCEGPIETTPPLQDEGKVPVDNYPPLQEEGPEQIKTPTP